MYKLQQNVVHKLPVIFFSFDSNYVFIIGTRNSERLA